MLTRKNVLDDFICGLDKQDRDSNEFELLEVVPFPDEPIKTRNEEYLW